MEAVTTAEVGGWELGIRFGGETSSIAARAVKAKAAAVKAAGHASHRPPTRRWSNRPHVIDSSSELHQMLLAGGNARFRSRSFGVLFGSIYIHVHNRYNHPQLVVNFMCT